MRWHPIVSMTRFIARPLGETRTGTTEGLQAFVGHPDTNALPMRNQAKPAVPDCADRGPCWDDRGPASALAVVSEQSDFAFQRANALGDACVTIRLRAQATERTGRLTGGGADLMTGEYAKTVLPSCSIRYTTAVAPRAVRTNALNGQRGSAGRPLTAMSS